MEDKDLAKYLLPVVAFFFLVTLSPAFAQEPDNSTQYQFQANQTSGEPILEQVSGKGIYRVLFRWPTQVLNQESGLEVEIVFLNASAPAPTSENIPQTETNYTGASTPNASGFNVPGSIESTLPVESYDIAIYDSNGNELFKRVDQPGLSGRGAQNFELEANHTGPVTIAITDIRPGWDSDKAAGEDQIDSVTFSTAVVPEFPLYLLGTLAAAIATVMAMTRTRIIRMT